MTDMNHHTGLSFVNEFRWVSTPSLRCPSLVHVASGAAIFTLLLRRRVAFLHRTATCRPLFKPRVSLLSTYKTIELCFEFLLQFFKVFIWLSHTATSTLPPCFGSCLVTTAMIDHWIQDSLFFRDFGKLFFKIQNTSPGTCPSTHS
jgi:hypothetical protein